jgi:putative nucleotidyltransferase with HDIG domain
MEQHVYTHFPAGERAEPRREAPAPNYRLRLLSAVNSMPPLPEALNRLVGMLNAENVSAGQIAAAIESDSVLSGSVLRCVNSAYYGMSRRVSSIRHAVTLLGFQTVRNLALAFSMRRMMTGGAASRNLYAAYSRHALATAILTQTLASFTRSCDIEAAFAAGLFHDIGKLLIFTAAPETVPGIVAAWERDESSLEEAERAVLQVTHTELSAIVLEGWKLPEAVRDAVRYHHDPDAQPAPEGQSPPYLVHLLRAADAVVNAEGLGAPVSTHRPPADPVPALQAAGLGADAPALVERFRGEFESLQGLFS